VKLDVGVGAGLVGDGGTVLGGLVVGGLVVGGLVVGGLVVGGLVVGGLVVGGLVVGGLVVGGLVVGGLVVGGLVVGGLVVGGAVVGDGGGVVGGAVVGGAVVGGLVVGGEVVGDDVEVGVQVGTVMLSSSRVTSPLRASARPEIVSPVVTVIDVRARMVPVKVDPVPRVAELPTCQKTLQAWAPLLRITVLAESVRSIDPTWKMKTAFGSFCASRVSAPLTSSDDEAL
jgi:hypothetical protein